MFTGLAAESEFIDSVPEQEDEIEFEFSIRLMDHVTLYDNRDFPFIVYIRYGNDTIINATGDIIVTVDAPDSDTTDLYWQAYIISAPNVSVFE